MITVGGKQAEETNNWDKREKWTGNRKKKKTAVWRKRENKLCEYFHRRGRGRRDQHTCVSPAVRSIISWEDLWAIVTPET